MESIENSKKKITKKPTKNKTHSDSPAKLPSFSIKPSVIPSDSHPQFFQKISLKNHLSNKQIVFGAVADTHLCNKNQRLDVLNAAYDTFEKRGIRCVLHAGNMIDGEAAFNKYEILAHGIKDQSKYVLDNYPSRKNIVTYFVDGDDHEGWYCFENGTEILTKENGWVDFKDLNPNHHVATKDKDGKFEWQIPYKIIKKPYDGEVIHLKHRSIDISVTPEHRFEVLFKSSVHGKPKKSIMTAQEIYDNFKSRCIGIPRTTENWIGNWVELINIPEKDTLPHTDKSRIWHPKTLSAYHLAIFCGWFVTEGHCDGNSINISQNKEVNPQKHQMIVDCVKNLGKNPNIYEDRINFSCKDLSEWLTENCGKGWKDKKLPQWILEMPKETLSSVFDAMICGDGHDRGDGSGWKFYSGSETLLAQMAEICQKLGLTVSYCDGNNCINMHIGEIHKTAYLFDKPEIKEYNGTVYCVSVPNERIFVRHNGKTLWSMNCQREGIQFGEYLMQSAKEIGRKDLQYLGYMESDILLKSKNGSSYMKLMHPGGGSCYAHSYKSQKLAESFQGGEKPSVVLMGHYHKMNYIFCRNIHLIQVPSMEDQTHFLRKKNIESQVGFVIVTLTLDTDGSVSRCVPEFYPFFNKNYYEKRDIGL